MFSVPVIPGSRSVKPESEANAVISRFPDVRRTSEVRIFDAPRNDEGR
jgi:hypothetical protein